MSLTDDRGSLYHEKIAAPPWQLMESIYQRSHNLFRPIPWFSHRFLDNRAALLMRRQSVTRQKSSVEIQPATETRIIQITVRKQVKTDEFMF